MIRVILLSSISSALVAAGVTAALMLWAVPGVINSPAVVRAERFEVVDQEGHVQARLGRPPNNDSLAILDTQGTERVGLKLLADGTSLFFLADGQGRVRANFYVDAGGTATAVQLFDDAGIVKQHLSLLAPSS